MLPANTAFDLYNSYCRWQTPTSDLHTALSRSALTADSRAAKDRAQAASSVAGRVSNRAAQYGFAAAAATSTVMALGDMVVGTGRGRNADIVGPNLGQSAADHIKSSLRHFDDTGLLGLGKGLPIGFSAALGAAAGACLGLVISAGDAAIHLGRPVGMQSQASRCKQRLGEWAGLGAMVGAGLMMVSPGGISTAFTLGFLRIVTALLKAFVAGVAWAVGAAVGGAVAVGAELLRTPTQAGLPPLPQPA